MMQRFRGRRGGHPRLHDDRGVGPRRAQRQHHGGARRPPLRPGPALPAPGPGGPEPPAGLLLPAGARHDRCRRRGTARRCSSITPTSGAGYRIALKDLEIRGAGNLLGAEQSGHAQAVGFDLYLRWLEETVQAAPGPGPDRSSRRRRTWCSTVRPICPTRYVPDDDVKLDLYRRLARAASSGDIDGLRDELRERFGPLPAEAETLLDMARLRVLGAALGLQHVLVRGDEARLTFRPGRNPAAGRAHLGARRRAARRRSAADGAALAPTAAAGRRTDRARAGAGAQGGGEVTSSWRCHAT